LGVIVLNWNDAEDTRDCLRSIATWRSEPFVWVVDNDSADGAGEIAVEFADARLIRSPVNRGFAGGNNLALEQAVNANCAFALLLNNDARIAQSDLDRLIAAIVADPSIGVIGPVLRDHRPPHRLLSAGGRDIARYTLSHDLELPPGLDLKEVAYVPGTVALIRSALLQKVGLLDERYFFGGEMADLCERARQAGFRSVIHTQAQAFHDLGRSSQMRDSLHVYYVFRNRFLFIRKFRSNRRWSLFGLWSVRGCGAATTSLAHSNVRRARAIGLGVWHGLTGQYGGRNEQVWPELRSSP
jgi:GT2 family glycosyltransferase